MEQPVVVDVQHVTMKFNLSTEKVDNLKEYFIRTIKRNLMYIQEKFDEIIDFAELRDFVDVPLKNYSSGMVARLGFAIATVIEPDILICDEILAVGDFQFQQKCEERINQMRAHGVTILFVSHSIEQVQRICHRALWLDHGHLKMIGPVDEVCPAYISQHAPA